MRKVRLISRTFALARPMAGRYSGRCSGRPGGLHPISEHADDNCSQEGEGDDGGEHIEPHPESHRDLLCRREPALRRRTCGAEAANLRMLRREAKQNSAKIELYLAALQ